MKSMREQQEKAKLEMQQWEKHLEEKESSMLARSDKTLRNRTTKMAGSFETCLDSERTTKSRVVRVEAVPNSKSR